LYSNEWSESKDILKKYFRMVFEESNVEWTSENDKEIDKLLDLIKAGSKKETEKVLNDAVRFL